MVSIFNFQSVSSSRMIALPKAKSNTNSHLQICNCIVFTHLGLFYYSIFPSKIVRNKWFHLITKYAQCIAHRTTNQMKTDLWISHFTLKKNRTYNWKSVWCSWNFDENLIFILQKAYSIYHVMYDWIERQLSNELHLHSIFFFFHSVISNLHELMW